MSVPPLSVELDSQFEILIRPNQNWIDFEWRELWEYRDLLRLMVRREFVAKYKQTILGPAWFVLQPILTTLVFSLVFGLVMGVKTSGIPAILFYLCGLSAWNFFAQNFAATSGTLVNNAHIFAKVYFPRLIVPLASVISNVFTYAIQIGTLLIAYAAFKLFSPARDTFSLQWEVIFIPIVVLQISAISLGAGLWMTALTARYRDFNHLSAFLMQLWMYGTPVIYPLSLIPQKWRWVFLLNPMTIPVEATKYVFLGTGKIQVSWMFVCSFVTCLFLVSAVLAFQRSERTFVDTV